MKIRKRSRLILAVDLFIDLVKFIALMSVLVVLTSVVILWMIQTVRWT
ncbi:hypothetical protein [Rhodococcus ruber]|nr:hypothetical protein [Rhodococcus ruber]MCF8783239.1 hypothetical protein [Rhodococcus ruber]